MSEETYEVEAILESKKVGSKEMFLIKWMGYAETTWEPLENLDGCSELLQKFREGGKNGVTKEEMFWLLQEQKTIGFCPKGFIRSQDNRKFDSNWYPDLEKVQITRDMIIIDVIRHEDSLRVIVSDGENEYQFDYHTFSELFPHALLSFVEHRLTLI